MMNNLMKNHSVNNISLIPIISIILLMGGCNYIPQTNSSCTSQPTGSLDSKNVKNIQLSSQVITETGQVSTNQYVGYTFTAKPGDKLNYQTQDNICIWVYAPNNQLITTKDLSQTGKYIIQVSALQGVTTFSLAMNIENQINATKITRSVSSTPPVLSSVKSQDNKDMNIENQINATKITRPVSSTPPVLSSVKSQDNKDTDTEETKNNSVDKSEKVDNNNNQTDTNSDSTNSDRISPVQAVQNYYNNLNKSDYENAWNILSYRMQTDTEAHPNGYDSYLEWWKQVDNIDTRLLRTKNNGDNATVTIRCKYTLASGRKISSRVKYYLIWNSDNNNWKINHVERI
ncbi:hypothetical protein H6F32_11440 [Anabaena sp. FACHB-1237]|uniref:hypothetical protein n=1 Tax=Anabaena sp. FACHB-1237 TaxID=2692769 RepID=UPI001680AD24|nr:hypothetical protein [Anabaena sp. FACHB-1237]MBD2138188.1 hypothetical protein [Anabaena sp. FACHB-1237]